MEFCERQAIADLQWLARCPPLIQTEQTYDFADVASANLDWGSVRRFLETKAAHRVGYYVESLVQVLLESDPGILDLQHGIQIRREKETLGELDFLFQRAGKLHHLEIALKFYLCYPEGAGNGSHFIGPNATDSFERKRDRLLGKQLPFGREHFPEIEESHHLVKGMIFYHPSDEGSVALPEQLNPDHARGLWIRESELSEFLCNLPTSQKGRILKKPFWLSGGGEDLSVEGIEVAAREYFAQWPGPVFLGLYEDNDEMNRLFIMPDCWPSEKK